MNFVLFQIVFIHRIYEDKASCQLMRTSSWNELQMETVYHATAWVIPDSDWTEAGSKPRPPPHTRSHESLIHTQDIISITLDTMSQICSLPHS